MKYTIDQYNEMPSREKINDRHRRNKRSEYHRVGDYFPYTLAKRVIKNNIGKSFEMAFHYFCTIVPKYQQKYFLQRFENRRHLLLDGDNRWNGYDFYSDYYIDDQGLIQTNKIPRPRNPIKIQLKPNIYFVKKEQYSFKKDRYIEWIKEESFNKPFNIDSKNIILAQDNAIYFDSKKDRTFMRMMRENKGKKIKKVKPSIEDFRPLLRAKQLKEKEETTLKLEAKGMSPNAFRGDRIR